MDNKQSNGRNGGVKELSASAKEKVFETKAFQISEDDGVSNLVGNIVEKGNFDNKTNSKSFSSTLPPKFTVLPFPVARHRSHGPHWGPIMSKKDGNEEDKEENGEFVAADKIAAFAEPLQRKQKQGLDFSKRAEPLNRSSLVENGKGNKSIRSTNTSEVNMQPVLEADTAVSLETNVVRESGESNMDAETLVTGLNLEPKQMLYKDTTKTHTARIDGSRSTSSVVHKTSVSSTVIRSESNSFENQRKPVSVESEIDVENRNRLEGMSPEEIAQAQAEIVEKMDPALLNLLKKRGQEKLKRQKISETAASKYNIMETPSSETQSRTADISSGFVTHKAQMQGSSIARELQKEIEGDAMQDTVSDKSLLWKAWSERVEAVRELRFSLDGTLVENHFVSTETGEKLQSADNAAERDFLRSEGDPGAAGYTIKEALALTRSAVPGQRSLALNLLACVLDKALNSICQKQVGCTGRNYDEVNKSTDWEAVWAYALGPEPELVLALRMALDDNHNSVVLACAKVIQCALSCDLNEKFFDMSEKIAIIGKNNYTAPVFRSRPEIDVGFLRGGFWKYSAKSSNIVLAGEESDDDEAEDKRTIHDDIIVAGQDVAAGLVRMGILPRVYYLLETEPTPALEDGLISILIAIARHSPSCTNAIMEFQKLVRIVVKRFTMNTSVEIQPSQIKSVCLLKVLAQYDNQICSDFVKNGTFQAMTWHLYQYISIDQWLKTGRESCKLSSSIMVEQLRFWKVCIETGNGISFFPKIFPVLCLWLHPPAFEKLMEKNLLCEFASLSKEAYLVLEALSRTLPNIYSQKLPANQSNKTGTDMEAWSWSYVRPMIDIAMMWISVTPNLFGWNIEKTSKVTFQDKSVTPLLWVYSAVMHLLSTILKRVIPDNATLNQVGSGKLPWLPEFVPNIGLRIIKNGLLSFSTANGFEYGKNILGSSSFTEVLCCLRQQNENESSFASVCCLHGLVQVVVSVEKLIHSAKLENYKYPPHVGNSSREGRLLESGILAESLMELRCLSNVFTKLVTKQWYSLQHIEVFGRGGPAPGVGVGWGAYGGGFWSTTALLAQTDSELLIQLMNIFPIVPARELTTNEGMEFLNERTNAALGVCLIAGANDRTLFERALDIMLQVPALKYLDISIQRFLQFNKKVKSSEWKLNEEDYVHFGEILASHFRERWLTVKRKSKSTVNGSRSCDPKLKSGSASLETIHEDTEQSCVTNQDEYSLTAPVEWAQQRLPLPMHWFLSPISTICEGKNAGHNKKRNLQNLLDDPNGLLEVAKAGLFFLLGIETMSTFVSSSATSPVLSVPLIWKLHSLSVLLLVGMGDQTSCSFFESLQELYGQYLDEARLNKASLTDKHVDLLVETGKNHTTVLLPFKSDIHESYTTFIDTLVEHYAAGSYGDLLYGRQLVIYLHRCVEGSVRLAAWNALSNARVLDLLPPLQKCCAAVEGYLQPWEDNEEILEAYAKSWVSGTLDKAAVRKTAAYTLALHHLSSFVFLLDANDKVTLRHKLVMSLMRDYSRKPKHEGMMLDLVGYSKESVLTTAEQNKGVALERDDIEKRFDRLKEACKGNSSLLSEVEKLKSTFFRKAST